MNLETLLISLGVSVTSDVIVSGIKSLFSKQSSPTPSDIKSEISTIIGNNNDTATEAIYNFMFPGHYTNGNNNIVMGSVNITNGNGNINIGSGNEINSNGSIAIGHGNKIG